MSDYNTFDLNVQCEENGSEVSEQEQAEVFAMMAEEAAAFEGYGDWSAQVEQEKDWLGAYTNRLPGPTIDGFDI